MTTHTNIAELKTFFERGSDDRSTRLAKLQGWRGDELACAVRSGLTPRLAPAVCGTLGVATAVTASVPLALATAASAAIGTFARNHPIEVGYNWFARRSDRSPIPANRAAKRLGCAFGTLFFGGAAVSFWAGLVVLGTVLAASIGVLALFVAASNVCVPSMLFTLLFGAERGAAASLFKVETTVAEPAFSAR